MKLHTECLACLVGTAVDQVKIATDDEQKQFEALREFLSFLEESFVAEHTPPYIGSERSRIIQEVTSNPDPYKELKEKSNRLAFELESLARDFVEDSGDRAKRLNGALSVVAAANSMEFGVTCHNFDLESFNSEFREIVKENPGVDDSDEVVEQILSSDEVLYLTDNCGEVVLDRILMEEIVDAGSDLFIGSKGVPVQEDVTVQTAREIGLENLGPVISTGESVGVFLEEAPSEIREKLESSDLIISKGMGNFETISEYEEMLEGRLVYILRAKCEPVARSFEVPRGKLVIASV